MAKRLKPTARWGEQWFRELSFKAKAILEYMEDKSATEQNGTGIYVADFGLMEFQMGKGFSISESELMELLGSIVDKIDEKTYFITTYFHDHYGDAKDTYAAKVAAKERLQKRELMDADGKIIRRKWGSLPPVSPDTPPTVSRDSGESLIILDSIESIKEGGVGETIGGEKSHETTPAPESQDPNPPPAKFKPDFERAFARYPVRVKGPDAEKRFYDQVKTPEHEAEFHRGLDGYLAMLDHPDNCDWRKPKQSFAAFLGTKKSGFYWRDYIGWKPPVTPAPSRKGGHVPFVPSRPAPPTESAPPPSEDPKNPDIAKAMKYAYVPGFTHAPWEDVRNELSQQVAGLIEQHGGWDEFKRRPAEENQALLTRVLNAPTASGNRDRASQAHALATSLAGANSTPEARKGIA